MTRYHGIETNTYQELILDSGAIYLGFVDVDNPGLILGATRGGAKFSRKPKYADLPYEGLVGKVVGSRFLTGVEVSIEAEIINFDLFSLGLAVPNSSITDTTITEVEWDPTGVFGPPNIAIVAEYSGSDMPIVFKLDNPLSENDLSFNFKDKSEAVSKWKFTAFYGADALDTAPWSIILPGQEPPPPPPPL